MPNNKESQKSLTFIPSNKKALCIQKQTQIHSFFQIWNTKTRFKHAKLMAHTTKQIKQTQCTSKQTNTIKTLPFRSNQQLIKQKLHQKKRKKKKLTFFSSKATPFSFPLSSHNESCISWKPFPNLRNLATFGAGFILLLSGPATLSYFHITFPHKDNLFY